jgi:hypothetical protein|tara:strand:- start:235 stop:507 length:273 start_codon:yes stop_codon:yes gene_type:complete
MAEIRYSGVPSQVVPGVGAGLQTKWADFLGAELPMGLIKSIPTPGAAGASGKRQQLIQALLKMLQEEEAGAAAGSGAAGVAPFIIPGMTG